MQHKLTLRNDQIRTRAQQLLAALPLEPVYEVVIRRHKSKRSLNQNSLLWKWYDLIRLHIADTTGQHYSAEELHEWFKSKFLPARLVEVAGEEIPCRRTTTKLNTAEMSDFMNQIDRYCADSLHLFLPQPGVDDD